MPTLRRFIATGLASLTVLVGCDVIQPDPDVAPKSIDATIYAFSGKPAVINLATVSDGIDLKLIESANTAFGQFEPVGDGKYLLFHPNEAFKGNNEEVTMSLVGSNNVKFANLKLNARSLDNITDCREASGVSDYAKIKSGETLVIDLLDNDIFCNVGYNGGLIGGVSLDSSEQDYHLTLGPGRKAELRYTASADFKGKFRFIYNLGINWTSTTEVPYEEVIKNPRMYLQAFTTALVEVEVE